MSKYQLRFWFEHAGSCIWASNDEAKSKYGYSIKKNSLPISKKLKTQIDILAEEYTTYLDWNCQQNSSCWTCEHKADFYNRAVLVYENLIKELGPDFEIKNDIKKSMG